MVGCYFSNREVHGWGAAGFRFRFSLHWREQHTQRYILILALGVAMVLCRPGVRDTISNLFQSTFQEDDVKAYSYNYRWRLWFVAFSENIQIT